MAVGRFAPSPTGPLHLGNLRTALVAWLAARSAGSGFLVRMEDLDRVQASVEHEQSQLADLAALGLDWDGEVVRQSERFDRYQASLAELVASGRTYPCYCSRREIREAAAAPHTVPGTYPGTCRHLAAADRSERERTGRPAALRLDASAPTVTVDDALLGPITGVVDDIVLRRNDGVPAYHLAVVVDDAVQGVEQVVRADDLASVAPAQRHLATLLGLPTVTYAHVPLVLGADGRRLAKRDRAATLADQATFGRSPAVVASRLLVSLGQGPLAGGETLAEAATRFDLTAIGRTTLPLDAMGLAPPS
jgi:glutamyl-tRNA synthetase